jgi:hypothetical protein
MKELIQIGLILSAGVLLIFLLIHTVAARNPDGTFVSGASNAKKIFQLEQEVEQLKALLEGGN